MTAVSLQCKLKSHHPEWSNVCITPPLSPSLPPRRPSYYVVLPEFQTYTQLHHPANEITRPPRYSTQPSFAGRPTTPKASRPRTSSWRRSATSSRPTLARWLSRNLRNRESNSSNNKEKHAACRDSPTGRWGPRGIVAFPRGEEVKYSASPLWAGEDGFKAPAIG